MAATASCRDFHPPGWRLRRHVRLIRTGRWDQAEELIQAALDHLDAADVLTGRADPMLSMGEVKLRQGHLAEAMQWTNDAIKLAERMGETVSLALGYEQLGELYAAQRDLDCCDAAFSRTCFVDLSLAERLFTSPCIVPPCD